MGFKSRPDIDGRADQYSLGIVAYRILAGRLPYEKEPTPVLLRRTAFEEMPPPSQFRSGLPPGVDAVFSRVLAKTPEGRFASCTAFVEALARSLRARSDALTARQAPDETKPEPVHLPVTGRPGPRPAPGPGASGKRVPAGLVLLGHDVLGGQVTVLQRPEMQPITVALRNLSGSQIKEWNIVMAGTLIAAVPTLLIYIILGRYFIRGLLAGSVKE